MIALRDIVRIVWLDGEYTVTEVATGWDPGTYNLTLVGANTRLVLRDCYEDVKGQCFDSSGNQITTVGRQPEPDTPDVNADGQLEIF